MILGNTATVIIIYYEPRINHYSVFLLLFSSRHPQPIEVRLGTGDNALCHRDAVACGVEACRFYTNWIDSIATICPETSVEIQI